MEVNWQQLIKVYAPYIVYGIFVALGGLYSLGYRNGQHSLLHAAEQSAKEVKSNG